MYGEGKYEGIDLTKLNTSLLGLIDYSKSIKADISLNSAVKLVQQNITVEAFLQKDKEQLSKVNAAVKRSMKKIMKHLSPEVIRELCAKRTNYQLILVDKEVTPSTVELLRMSLIHYDELFTMDYETFKEKTGGKNREVTYDKLMKTHMYYEQHVYNQTITSHAFYLRPLEDQLLIALTKSIDKKVLKIEIQKFLQETYDTLPATFTIHDLTINQGMKKHLAFHILHNLTEQGFLTYKDHLIKKQLRTFDELMNWEGLLYKKELIWKLQKGLGDKEIAKKQKVSRQRVSQKILKSLSYIPISHVVDAKECAVLFQTYHFSEESFSFIFNERPEIYRFLVKKLKKGDQSISESSIDLTSEQHKRLIEYLNSK